MDMLESVWRSPICPHRQYAFRQKPYTRPRARVGPFFQVILGMDRIRVKQVLGELAKPFDNGPQADIIRYGVGGREAQRFHWIQSLAGWEDTTCYDVFELLLHMKLIHQYRHEIPHPFEGDAAMDFTDKVNSDYYELKEIASIPYLAFYRRYLMNHWFDFRAVGEWLIEHGITLQDILKVYHQNRMMFGYHDNISHVVQFWL